MKTKQQNASIFYDLEHLRKHIDLLRGPLRGPQHASRYGKSGKDFNRIVLTSGGFDPLHVGHLQCIQSSADIAGKGILIVVVNGDSFLRNKKGYAFMDEESRMQIISAINGVDYVVLYEDPEDMTVCKPIEILKPNFFTKGGDRDSSTNVPEFDTCQNIGCEVIFSVGGGKIQSSSELVGDAMKELSET